MTVSKNLLGNRLRDILRDQLRDVYDIERLLARVSTGRASPRDLAHIGKTTSTSSIQGGTQVDRVLLVQAMYDTIDLCPELCDSLEAALVDDCPLLARDGGILRDGYNEQLDELREKLAAGVSNGLLSTRHGKQNELEEANLKVGFNKVFGYYLELSNANKDKAPEEYIRKQTLENAERYITPELKEYEEEVLSSDDKGRLEYELFLKLRDEVHEAQDA